MLVGLFAMLVGLAVPAMAVTTNCCTPGAACCGSPCCD
jgi:hypothetical protein